MTTISLGNDMRFGTRYRQASPEAQSRQACSLAHAVEYAVGQVDGRVLRPVTRSGIAPTFHADKMLALLTFCYARQIYSSTKIAALLRRDFNSTRVAGNDLPDARVLERFRCENRGPLNFCLRSVLLFLAEEKIQQGFVTHVKEAHITQEASRRVIMAMFTDSLEMEQDSEPAAPLELSFEASGELGRMH